MDIIGPTARGGGTPLVSDLRTVRQLNTPLDLIIRYLMWKLNITRAEMRESLQKQYARDNPISAMAGFASLYGPTNKQRRANDPVQSDLQQYNISLITDTGITWKRMMQILSATGRIEVADVAITFTVTDPTTGEKKDIQLSSNDILEECNAALKAEFERPV